MMKNIHHNIASLCNRLPVAWRLAVVASLASLLLTGCPSTGGDRTAANEPAATRTAKEGTIHRGDTEEAVLQAWGKPDHTATRRTRHGMQEAWTYTQTHHGHGGGYYGISRGWTHSEDGGNYDHDTYYPAPHSGQTLGNNATTEVPVKRAIFEKGKVLSYETTHHGHVRSHNS